MYVGPKCMIGSIDWHINPNKWKYPKGSKKRSIYQHRFIYQGEKVLQWDYGPFAFSILSQQFSGKTRTRLSYIHDPVIKWKYFLHYQSFVQGIHWSAVNSPHKGQWHGALMFSLVCSWINVWVNNWEAGDLRCHRVHYDVTVMNQPWLLMT